MFRIGVSRLVEVVANFLRMLRDRRTFRPTREAFNSKHNEEKRGTFARQCDAYLYSAWLAA